MSKGIVFNIQKFSIHDGPGIRTTVFFKGCPLKCQWCSNPESQLKQIQILYDKTKCAGCQTCVHTCPLHAITFSNQQVNINFNQCVSCLQCIHNCKNHALTHEGEYKTVDEVVDICLQDIDFYEESDGGVTISGGEGMNQPEFLKELVLKLKEHKIHTAIETTGFIQSEIFRELAPLFDLLLFDVKHYDREKHFAGTGVYNDQIIENLIYTIKTGLPVLPRIPVIPGFNDSLEDAMGIASLLNRVNAMKVQLLPFHQFGEKKYELLNREYTLKNETALHPEDLKEYQQIFLDAGIQCFF